MILPFSVHGPMQSRWVLYGVVAGEYVLSHALELLGNDMFNLELTPPKFNIDTKTR